MDYNACFKFRKPGFRPWKHASEVINFLSTPKIYNEDSDTSNQS